MPVTMPAVAVEKFTAKHSTSQKGFSPYRNKQTKPCVMYNVSQKNNKSTLSLQKLLISMSANIPTNCLPTSNINNSAHLWCHVSRCHAPFRWKHLGLPCIKYKYQPQRYNVLMQTMASKCDPPFETQYKKLQSDPTGQVHMCKSLEECELPLIDLSKLSSEDKDERMACAEEIGRASSEWGFFQVLNHGISLKLLTEMWREQIKLFKLPFDKKENCGILNGSYRWGTPTAASLKNFSWSEAFHVPLSMLAEEDCCNEEFTSLREVMEEVAMSMSNLARTLACVLAENLGYPGECFTKNCNKSTCFLRLNRYPPCPYLPETFGLMPHTDSDFLTILYQDEVGGLQLMKDSKWVAVKPNLAALIVNIGDLFQAWSNDVYRSAEHKVKVNAKVERYSIAYFLCPSHDSTIGSCKEPSPYKKFTFGEFRKQVQDDVNKTGYKVGLPRFLIQSTS